MVRTDHHASRWILILADATGKRARWRLRLLESDFEIVLRAGVKYQAANALSRFVTRGDVTNAIRDDIPVLVVQT